MHPNKRLNTRKTKKKMEDWQKQEKDSPCFNGISEIFVTV